jgi:hypothetical protein
MALALGMGVAAPLVYFGVQIIAARFAIYIVLMEKRARYSYSNCCLISRL